MISRGKQAGTLMRAHDERERTVDRQKRKKESEPSKYPDVR